MDLNDLASELEQKPQELTPRQWWLYRLVKKASENGEKLSVKDIINYQEQCKDKLTFKDLYVFKDSEGNHSNCPQIYADKDAINESDRLDKILCVKNNQFYIGTEREQIEYHNKLMHNVCRDSHKCKIIRDKISRDGQVYLFTYDFNDVENSKSRGYHDSFINHQSLIKENDDLKEKIKKLNLLVEQYKNESKMWKERFYAKEN